jgi:hypothetical protein
MQHQIQLYLPQQAMSQSQLTPRALATGPFQAVALSLLSGLGAVVAAEDGLHHLVVVVLVAAAGVDIQKNYTNSLR